MEQYPQLTATQGFADLRVQLEGTENRISTERMRYNETAKTYNVYVRQFPGALWANVFGFEVVNLFEADEAAQTAPEVSF
jgi:LemA protein